MHPCWQACCSNGHRAFCQCSSRPGALPTATCWSASAWAARKAAEAAGWNGSGPAKQVISHEIYHTNAVWGGTGSGAKASWVWSDDGAPLSTRATVQTGTELTKWLTADTASWVYAHTGPCDRAVDQGAAPRSASILALRRESSTGLVS
jgi:hypothetical protein